MDRRDGEQDRLKALVDGGIVNGKGTGAESTRPNSAPADVAVAGQTAKE